MVFMLFPHFVRWQKVVIGVVWGILLASSGILVGFVLMTYQGDRVFPYVSFLDTEVGGMTRTNLESMIGNLSLGEEVFNFIHPDTDEVLFSRTAEEIGYTIDEEKIANHIMAFGRDLSFRDQFMMWLLAPAYDAQVPADTVFFDQDRFAEFFHELHQELGDQAANPGNFSFDEEGNLVVTEPQNGYRLIDMKLQNSIVALLNDHTRNLAQEDFDKKEIKNNKKDEIDALSSGSDQKMNRFMLNSNTAYAQEGSSDIPTNPAEFNVELPFAPNASLLTSNDFDMFREKLEYITGSEYVMRVNTYEQELEQKHLIKFINPLWNVQSQSWDLRFNREACSEILDLWEVKNARLSINPDMTVSVSDSRPGFAFDNESACDKLVAMVEGDQDEALLSYVGEPVMPTKTRDAYDNLGLKHVIAEFTTYFTCCQNRVDNIQNMARRVDGAVIMPGGTFNLNQHVGQRTAAKGFKPAGAILYGEMIKSVGGGVSQFATTLYNSAYWSGISVPEHRAHSKYFSRYPEGIESTVSWTKPNVRIYNDYATPVMIDTAYTDTSITVRILGDNDGRILDGSHTSGATDMRVINAGGDKSRIVESNVSDRYNVKSAATRYIAYDTVAPGTQKVVDKGKNGWTVRVTRTITYNDKTGAVIPYSWPVTYNHPRVVHVASCAYAAPGAYCVKP